MTGAIGALLPAALTVFVSPMPITALLLLLLSRRGIAPALAYAGGWLLGIGIEIVGFTALGGLVSAQTLPAATAITIVIDLIIAVTMLTLAFLAWHRRPRPGVQAKTPVWMRAIDRMSPWYALGLALVFAIFSPVNLSVTAGAGTTIATGGFGLGATVALVAGFLVLGMSSITGPLLAFVLAGERVRRALEALRAWLVAHNAVVVTVLMLVVGADYLGKAIAAF